jgi:hypothetical protein
LKKSFKFVSVTTTTYNIVKKALLKKRAEVTASPAAAKRFLVKSGLWDVLEKAPANGSSQKGAFRAKKAAKKSA